MDYWKRRAIGLGLLVPPIALNVDYLGDPAENAGKEPPPSVVVMTSTSASVAAVVEPNSFIQGAPEIAPRTPHPPINKKVEQS